MRSHVPPRAFGPASLVASALALAFAAALGACGGEEGTTPTCVDDMSDPAQRNVDNGCNPFAVCRDSKGNEADPVKVCCAGLDGSDLAYCLYGYGVGPAPSTSSAGGGGSTTSTTSGAGGAGGGT
jgi:hypothetical protein